MASAASARAWKVLGRRGSDSRSRGLRGEESYAILLGVLPVVKENVLFSKDYMRGSISGRRERFSRA